ncbi:hypothetical protein Fcan01_20859 [Folsomia candida]|uniref:Uncharacterized protein n=1 Tax=Folsomia candida TaxID=158441 RepID=A0A226DJM5_FOLCA|nr:hypothetical protein Fcan01_20859 [Folsomia candida]
MVVTSLMWKSLDRFSRYFGIFWKNPVEWDIKTQTLVFTPISRKLIPWMVSVYGFLTVLNGSLLLILISQLYGFAHLKLTKVVILLCWSGHAVFGLVLEILVAFTGKNASYAFNCLSALAKKIGGRTSRQKSTMLLDLKGIMLNLIVIFLYLETFNIYLFAIISSNLDPYSQLYPLFVSKGWSFQLLANFGELLLTLLRFICLPVMASYLALECISTLGKMGVYYMSSRNKVTVDKYLRGYAGLQVIFKIADEYLAPSTAVSMFIPMWVSVLLNFISLNLYGIIPPSIFPYFPVAALFVGGCIRLLLPLLVDLYEECLVLQARWRYLLSGSDDKKYLKRKLRSLRSVAVYGGILGYNLYKCKRSTKMAMAGMFRLEGYSLPGETCSLKSLIPN